MKTSINRKLQVGLGLSLLLLIVSSIFSYIAIRNLLSSSQLVDHSNEVVMNLEKIMSVMKDAETGQRGYLLTNKNAFLEPYNGSFDRAIALLDKVEQMTITSEVQQKNIESIRTIILKRLNVLQQLLDKKNSGEKITVDDLLTGKDAMDELRSAISKAVIQEKILLEGRTSTLKNASMYTLLVIAFAAIIAILVSAFSYIRITRDMLEKANLQSVLQDKDEEMTSRISMIHHVAEQIAQGDYSIRMEDEKEDNLGSLALALNKMAVSLETSFNSLTENEWMQTGMSALNDHMIGEKNESFLAKDILEFVANYVHSQTGAFYLIKHGKLFLESGYALKDMPKQLALGEGLPGQSALSDEVIWLKEMDEKDITINYATGAIKAKNVIVVPIHYEKKVTGVIELASTNEYSERELKYVQNVSANIGIAINSAQSHRQLQELLEETQAQSEELQAQHGELEHLNSELEAHAQRLQASEEELRTQQEELLQTNADLEERNRLINTRNIEIQQKAEELAQSTRYKSEFMANMSHELRTPLNSILLLSRYLTENSEQNLTAEQIESASIILNSGNGLLNLIDELLDLSKIEAGKVELEYQNVELDDIITNMQSLFAPVAKEKQLKLLIRNEVQGLQSIHTDLMRLEQILKNLLSNALKFTSEGEVQVLVHNNPANNGYIDFTIKDTGIGIPKDKQQLVFGAFQQADGSTKRKFGGTGLGLSISKELAQLLGGEITLTSTPGKGSEFTVTIPIDKTAAISNPQVPVVQQQQPVPQAPERSYITTVIPDNIPDDRNSLEGKDKVILIVEDDTTFAKALLRFTRQSGYKGIVAVRGDDGIVLAQKYHPVAILLDIQLPVLDGWTVLDELKSNSSTRHIPVHIMSSLEVQMESRRKGAVDFINKPIAIEQMKRIFKKLEDAMSQSPNKVLIVEENTKHAQALAFFLETFNITSSISGNVHESLEALQSEEVNCVIMDMGLPAHKGYETLEAIKQQPGLENLPIIVFTGKSLSSPEENHIRQYVDTIVVKTAHSYQRILDEVALFLHLIKENDEHAPDKAVRHIEILNKSLAGKTVLLADDDARNIFSITKYLEVHGMKVLSATDGQHALQQLERHPEISIVLMDMMMPNMDGYESISKIRKHPVFKSLPVIAVTAKAMLGDREKCIAAGASDYISKPVDIDQLISLLRIWLSA